MWTSLQRLGCAAAIAAGASAGINWKSIWLEPRTHLVLTVGATQPFTVMGRNGADVKVDLTQSQELTMTSSDPDVLDIDRKTGMLTAKKRGHAHVEFAFSEVGEMLPAYVRPSAPAADRVDGVWRAEFTGPLGERPKMVSEIFFDLNADGGVLTGTVHAAHWPGDATITDGKIEGNRVRFTMVGTSSFNANGVIGYPKLCFDGTRAGSQMKIDLLWTEARRPCDDARHYPMAAKKLLD
jgi:hypothetical protein